MRFLPLFISFVISGITILSPHTTVADDSLQGASVTVAKVGNLEITREDVSNKVQELMPMSVGFHGSVSAEKIDEIKRQAMEYLINRAYKAQYAIDEEISVDAATFEAELSKKYRRPENDVEQVLYSKLRANLYISLLAQKAEKIAVDDKVKISEEQVSAYYRDNKSMYYRPRLYKASHVFVKVDPSASAEDKKAKLERAEMLYKRAQSGEDFYNLAYYESDDRSRYVGGNLGYFHSGQTVAEFDAAIKNMKPGEVVGPVRTIYGYHIIRLDEVQEERQMEFDEVASKIHDKLTEAEKKRLYEKWMSELMNRYTLERFDQ